MSSSSSSSSNSSAEEGDNEFTPTHAIFPKLMSPDEEERLLEARIMELKKRKTMAQSSTTSAYAYEQIGNAETNDDGSTSSLDDGGQKHVIAGQFKAILKRMSALEKKQRQNEAGTKALNVDLQTKFIAFEEQQKKIWEKISTLENFVGLLKERFGKELAVQSNFCPKIPEKFSNLHQNCWDANDCHSDLSILGNDCLMVQYFGDGNASSSSVFAKFAIPNRSESDIFYYEITVENMTNFVSIGLATKAMPSYGSVGQHLDSYGYESNGTFLVNGTSKYGKENYADCDVVGLGVNLITRQIIFTKNGLLLDTAHLFLSPSFSSGHLLLFPCVTLNDYGDKIEANFGPNFIFDSANLKVLAEYRVKFNFWDVDACHDDLEISGPNYTVVQHKKNVSGCWSTVIAEYCISHSAVDDSCNISYFELIVQNVKNLVAFGFTPKHQTPLNRGILNRAGTYAYLWNGNFWINGPEKDGNERFGSGDIVGCGVNFASKKLFFTKNGHRIDVTSDFRISSSPSADSLFPFVSLSHPNEKIEANFGPEFMFDISTLC